MKGKFRFFLLIAIFSIAFSSVMMATTSSSPPQDVRHYTTFAESNLSSDSIFVEINQQPVDQCFQIQAPDLHQEILCRDVSYLYFDRYYKNSLSNNNDTINHTIDSMSNYKYLEIKNQVFTLQKIPVT